MKVDACDGCKKLITDQHIHVASAEGFRFHVVGFLPLTELEQLDFCSVNCIDEFIKQKAMKR